MKLICYSKFNIRLTNKSQDDRGKILGTIKINYLYIN